MLRIGVPSNEKIFEAFQTLVGEKIALPKGIFFVPFRGHELVFARVEEITSLTSKGCIDVSFTTRDHLSENENNMSIVAYFPDYCRCDLSIITAEEGFSNRNPVEVFTEFYRQTGQRAVLATRFPQSTTRYLRVMKNFRDSATFPVIKKVSGAEELQILLGSADFAVSRIESGETLKLNHLFVVERIIPSYLVVVGRKNFLFSQEIENFLYLIKPKPRYSGYRENESIH